MSETVQEIKPFDLNVQIRDPKTRATIKVQPYIRHAKKIAEGGSMVLYERDGKFYHENNGENPVKDEENWVLQSKDVEPKSADKGPQERKATFLGR